MNSRTVIEEPTAPPSDSSLKISASRAFSAPFVVLAPTVREVRAVSPVTGSTWGLRGNPGKPGRRRVFHALVQPTL